MREHIAKPDFRMVITPFLFRILAILNSFFRAPLQARETLLTRVLPYGLSCGNENVLRRAELRAYTTTGAFLVS